MLWVGLASLLVVLCDLYVMLSTDRQGKFCLSGMVYICQRFESYCHIELCWLLFYFLIIDNLCRVTVVCIRCFKPPVLRYINDILKIKFVFAHQVYLPNWLSCYNKMASVLEDWQHCMMSSHCRLLCIELDQVILAKVTWPISAHPVLSWDDWASCDEDWFALILRKRKGISKYH